MTKIPINKEQEATQSTKEAVANASPIVKAFCEKIMSFYDPTNKPVELFQEEKEIQSVFDNLPKDEFTNRLAKVVEVITGYLPVTKLNTYPLCSLVKSDNVVYAVVYSVGGTVYGINSSCTSNIGRRVQQSTKPTTAEAGIFCKEMLAVSDVVFLPLVASLNGSYGLKILLEEISK